MKRIQDLETQQKEERLALQQEAEKQQGKLQSLMDRFENMMVDSAKRPDTKRGRVRDDEPSTKPRDDVETGESSSSDEEKEQYITTPDGQKVTWDYFLSTPFFQVSSPWAVLNTHASYLLGKYCAAAEVPITPDALRMRVRRMCEKKSTGRLNVPVETQQDYMAGGERRECLELAYLEAIARHGKSRNVYKKVKAWGWRYYQFKYIYNYRHGWKILISKKQQLHGCLLFVSNSHPCRQNSLRA